MSRGLERLHEVIQRETYLLPLTFAAAAPHRMFPDTTLDTSHVLLPVETNIEPQNRQ